jgi:hypothetical protein
MKPLLNNSCSQKTDSIKRKSIANKPISGKVLILRIYQRGTYIPTYLSSHLGMFFSYHSFMLFKITLRVLSRFLPFPLFYVNNVLNIPGDQEGLFKLAIQLRKFLFITL